MTQSKTESTYFFDNPRNVQRVVLALYCACVLSILAEFFIHKHGHFVFENWFAFHAMFGFVAYVSLIFIAKTLRRWLQRDETYYEQ